MILCTSLIPKNDIPDVYQFSAGFKCLYFTPGSTCKYTSAKYLHSSITAIGSDLEHQNSRSASPFFPFDNSLAKNDLSAQTSICSDAGEISIKSCKIYQHVSYSSAVERYIDENFDWFIDKVDKRTWWRRQMQWAKCFVFCSLITRGLPLVTHKPPTRECVCGHYGGVRRTKKSGLCIQTWAFRQRNRVYICSSALPLAFLSNTWSWSLRVRSIFNPLWSVHLDEVIQVGTRLATGQMNEDRGAADINCEQPATRNSIWYFGPSSSKRRYKNLMSMKICHCWIAGFPPA